MCLTLAPSPPGVQAFSHSQLLPGAGPLHGYSPTLVLRPGYSECEAGELGRALSSLTGLSLKLALDGKGTPRPALLTLACPGHLVASSPTLTTALWLPKAPLDRMRPEHGLCPDLVEGSRCTRSPDQLIL